MSHLVLQYPEPGLAIIQLAGHGRLNLMSYAMLAELLETAQRLQANRSLRAVIITGTADAFSAGMNLDQGEVRRFEQYSIEERLDIHAMGARACAAWENLDAMTLCAIEGYCLGGGLAFAVACDWRVASRTAQFQAPELRNGMNMSWQSIPRLVALCGMTRTRQMVMRLARIDGETAQTWGLVDELAEPGASLERAIQAAHDFMALPRAPLRMTKHAIRMAASPLGHAVSYMDLEQYAICQATDSHRDAIDQFFARR